MMKRKLLIALISFFILGSGLFLWRGTIWFELFAVYKELKYANDEFIKSAYITTKELPADTITSDVTPISLLSNKKLRANLILLKLKSRLFLQSDVYAFETEHVKGFHFNSTSGIGVRAYYIFSTKANVADYFEIVFYGEFSSEEVDLIISTMKFVE